MSFKNITYSCIPKENLQQQEYIQSDFSESHYFKEKKSGSSMNYLYMNYSVTPAIFPLRTYSDILIHYEYYDFM